MGEGDSKLAVDPADLGLGRLFDEIRDAVIVGEAITEKIVLWNRAACKMFGYTEADAIGKPIHMLIPPRLRARHRAGLAHYAATGEGTLMTEGSVIEVPGMLASGDEIDVELSLSPVEHARVPGRYVMAIVRDVSRRTSPEKTHSPAEPALLTMTKLLDDLPVGVFVIKEDGRPFYANKSALTLLGRQITAEIEAEEFAQEYQAFIPGTEEIFPGDQQPIVRALRGERQAKAEMSLRRDGKESLINVTATPILDGDGEVRFAVATFDDISAQRAIEDRIRQLHKMEALGQVTAGVAHNFNNLLAIILNFIEFALETLPKESTEYADLVQAQAAAERGAELVSNLMSYLRQRPLRFEPIEIAEAVESARDLLESLLGPGIILEIHRPDEGAWARFDNGEMLNVLVNLVANARHAMGNQGSLAISVDTAHRDAGTTPTGLELAAGRFVHLAVADSGKGIPDHVLKRIFDPFFTTKDPTKGTGLGLSTVLGTIEAAGGGVEVESTPGEGTTFHLYLPVADDAGAKAQEGTPPY
jgi:PAS domain S-box-containing protein